MSLLSDNIFAPKTDLDLDNVADEDEREIEAFKRFCYNSVPQKQKPKVNIDLSQMKVKK